eukprot:TRINITY_DN7663_c0_g3_i2.p1 TRINITY_DN7663_c0_g3~~TRINITY_DN7663_c0_g3_i2.p1  ORF type:complete len:309 (-),score=30.41 TRINITY_DN7663_c0_g3_i2:479-1405(-)
MLWRSVPDDDCCQSVQCPCGEVAATSCPDATASASDFFNTQPACVANNQQLGHHKLGAMSRAHDDVLDSALEDDNAAWCTSSASDQLDKTVWESLVVCKPNVQTNLPGPATQPTAMYLHHKVSSAAGQPCNRALRDDDVVGAPSEQGRRANIEAPPEQLISEFPRSEQSAEGPCMADQADLSLASLGAPRAPSGATFDAAKVVLERRFPLDADADNSRVDIAAATSCVATTDCCMIQPPQRGTTAVASCAEVKRLNLSMNTAHCKWRVWTLRTKTKTKTAWRGACNRTYKEAWLVLQASLKRKRLDLA